MRYILMIIGVSFSISSHGNELRKFGLYSNEAKLICYDYIKDIHMEGASPSTYESFQIKPQNLKDYAHQVFKNPTKQFLIIPSQRAGVAGFYLISDANSTWISMPRNQEKKCYSFTKGELGSQLFVTYDDSQSFSNPAKIFTEKPAKDCVPTKAKLIIDDDFRSAFREDLISRISNVPEHFERRRAIYQSQRKSGDKSKTESSLIKSTIEPLDRCRELLDKDRDREVIAMIDGVKSKISPKTNIPG